MMAMRTIALLACFSAVQAVQAVQAVGNDHVYFGWAPTSTSGNHYWAFTGLRIMQNGINIVDITSTNMRTATTQATINYNGALPSPASDQGNPGYIQYYPPAVTWTGYWAANHLPLLYIQATAAVDGTTLTSVTTNYDGNPHAPGSGHIVSAATQTVHGSFGGVGTVQFT
jgi:hypothetical protein